MGPAVRSRGITITTTFGPRAAALRSRTKGGRLSKEARRWHDGLAWAAKLEMLDSRRPLRPPYDVIVNGYFPTQGTLELPQLRDWFDAIAAALGEAFDVTPAQLRLTPGRVGYAQPLSPAHFEIVVSKAGDKATPAQGSLVTCPSCGIGWALDPDAPDGDRCPHCGHEDAGLPFTLGVE